MRASELIEELQKLIEDHGDLELRQEHGFSFTNGVVYHAPTNAFTLMP